MIISCGTQCSSRKTKDTFWTGRICFNKTAFEKLGPLDRQRASENFLPGDILSILSLLILILTQKRL